MIVARSSPTDPVGRHAARASGADPLDLLLRGAPRRSLPWPPPTGWLLAVAAAVAVGAMAWMVLGQRHDPAELTLPRATPANPTPADPAPANPAPAAGVSTTVPSIGLVAHVAGAVNHPGLVRLAPGARVDEAIAAAGGFRPDADLDRVNLAAPVTDGERVYVLALGQQSEPPAAGPASAPSAAASAPDAVVDLNAATMEQLDSLPGVGPATAKAIIDHRSQHGPFRRVEDLLDVRGIGDAKLEALRPSVRVGS